VVATNYPVWVGQLRAELFGGLDVGWYPSCECGVRKPDPRYFAGLCAAFGIRAADLVLVDDKAVNTDAVRRLGGRAITFDSAADTRARLTALLS
jgi:HAD superfamily hydrolase (TIGR01509 family)